jgi:hypothetical protein
VKPTFLAAAVMLGVTGAIPVSAEPVRLAQTFAADVIPPFEAFTIVRSMGLRPLGRPHYRGRSYVVRALDRQGREVSVVVDARAARVVSVTPREARSQAQYDGPRPYRRYDSGPPPSDPRYAPSPPEYGAPQGAPGPYGEPDDDEDDSEFLPDEEPEEFAPDGEDEDESGALPPRPDMRTLAAPRVPPAPASSRGAAVTQPKTPLPRSHPVRQASADSASTAAPQAARESETPASGTKPDAAKPAVRIIDMKKPEPRI